MMVMDILDVQIYTAGIIKNNLILFHADKMIMEYRNNWMNASLAHQFKSSDGFQTVGREYSMTKRKDLF